MTTFAQFAANCRMRHDFADRIQVRYRHHDGQEFDTWVSGTEALKRMHSADVEERLRALGDLTLDEVEALRDDLPDLGRDRLRKALHEHLSLSVEDTLGDSILAQSLADLVDGNDRPEDDPDSLRQRWHAHLNDGRFKAVVLELAYIQLEGSLPEDTPPGEADDWVTL